MRGAVVSSVKQPTASRKAARAAYSLQAHRGPVPTRFPLYFLVSFLLNESISKRQRCAHQMLGRKKQGTRQAI